MVSYTYEPTRNESVIVSNTSQVILQGRNGNNDKRKSFVIRNIADDASKIITLNIGSQIAISNKGIVLRQGEVYYESNEASLDCWQGEITAICVVASATATLSIMER